MKSILDLGEFEKHLDRIVLNSVQDQEVPRVLYHYTSWNGVEEIIIGANQDINVATTQLREALMSAGYPNEHAELPRIVASHPGRRVGEIRAIVGGR